MTISAESPESTNKNTKNWKNSENYALITISPEAFKDNSYSYQSIIKIIRPKLISDLQFVNYAPGEMIDCIGTTDTNNSYNSLSLSE